MLYLFSLLLTERDHFPVLSHKKLGEVFFIHGDAHFVPILSLRNVQGLVKVHLKYHGSAILGNLRKSLCIFSSSRPQAPPLACTLFRGVYSNPPQQQVIYARISYVVSIFG
jgi:hypothetical protein